MGRAGAPRSSGILGLLLLCAAVLWTQEPAPRTPTREVRETLHGVEVVDPYRWLEDQNSPETRAWIEAQNAYTRSMIGALPGRVALKRRLTELMKIEAIRTPWEVNGRYFFSKRLADQEQFVIYVRKGLRGRDEVLVDPHPMSPDRTTSVQLYDVSQDGTRLAYGLQQGGEDEVTLHLLDVDRRKDLPDRLPKGRYSGVSLRPDKTGLYYARFGPEGPRVYHHVMGTDPTGDTEIFGKGYGRDKWISPSLSDDGRHLLIHVSHGAAADQTEVYYQDLARRSPIVPIVNDLAARFLGTVAGSQLFLQTNWKAPRGRILAVDLKNPSRDRWRVIVPESDAVIEGFTPAGGRLFVNYTHNVSSRVEIFEPGGKQVRDIAFPTLGTVSGINGRWKSAEAFFSFGSFHVPANIYRYDVRQGSRQVWARLAVPMDSDKLEVRQVWYESKDRTRVPMFLLHARGIQLDGSNPTLMRAYGGFNVSLTPAFSASAVLWAERGGVYAVPNLRGGGEFGEEWHKAGMREKKQNVFDDFIAAAEWLIRNGYTRPGKLAISGRSNGGLLVGAALTQRPDLFEAVWCGYPLLDMLRYHQFSIARLWVSEYGSSEDPAQFRYLYAYSPYHRVKPGTKYPAVLVTTGDSDTRVAPLHARKMAALLQASTASDKPVLLQYDTKLGHSGGEPLSRRIEDLTDELGFLLWWLGTSEL